jgi:hypothetical protein
MHMLQFRDCFSATPSAEDRNGNFSDRQFIYNYEEICLIALIVNDQYTNDLFYLKAKMTTSQA